MKKLLIVGMIGAVALFVIAKKTHTFSYVTTLCASVTKETQESIPTKFEIERIRNEIANLDGDVGNMIRPIAEFKAEIERCAGHQQEPGVGRRSQEGFARRRWKLEAAEKADKGFVTLQQQAIPGRKVKSQLQRGRKREAREKNLKTQQQVLEAKEASLKATQEQLAKVVSRSANMNCAWLSSKRWIRRCKSPHIGTNQD